MKSTLTLLRSPMLSQAQSVVANVDVSLNTEIRVIRRLSVCAQQAQCTHGVILMVGRGDLREEIMPSDLRSGESILLGREPLQRQPIRGLHTDAFTLAAEVIEVKTKPSEAVGEIEQSAFGEPPAARAHGEITQCILAIGRQDSDPLGLESSTGIEILAAASDHLVASAGSPQIRVGVELEF